MGRVTTVTGPLPNRCLPRSARTWTCHGTVTPLRPRIVPKGARRLERLSWVVPVHPDIRLELKRMYGVDVSPALVSKVTDGILEELLAPAP